MELQILVYGKVKSEYRDVDLDRFLDRTRSIVNQQLMLSSAKQGNEEVKNITIKIHTVE